MLNPSQVNRVWENMLAAEARAFHIAAIALGYFAYNFIKVHRTLRMSPAMAAGVTDRLWDVADFTLVQNRPSREFAPLISRDIAILSR